MKLIFWVNMALIAINTSYTSQTIAAEKPYNILLIAVDDLNSWAYHSKGNKQVITPNIDKLAANGMSFQNAYATSAVCNQTRTAMLTGMRPGTTGVYDNSTDWRSVIGDGYTIHHWFKANGYKTLGGGKLYHKPDQIRSNDFDVHYDDNKGKRYSLEGLEAQEKITGKTLRYKVGELPIAELAAGDDAINDYHIARWASEELDKRHDKPFFLSVGIFRPHLPWNVPKKYFDLYPLDDIELPPYKADDLTDLPYHKKPSKDHQIIFNSDDPSLEWKKGVRAYLASITYADKQIGRVLEALENSQYKDNTIVVLWGDHGWHLGEKLHWRKSALWEESTSTTYIWSVPKVTKAGSATTTPVDTQTFWPTLAELTVGKPPEHVEGNSLVPLLKDPSLVWDIPAITTYHLNNHAIRSQQYRYISYARGEKELYHHKQDPYEWNNLAKKPDSISIMIELDKWLPTINRTTDEGRNLFSQENGIKNIKP